MQAASNLESLKVKDSPVKKIDFSSENKENMPVTDSLPAFTSNVEIQKKPVLETVPSTEVVKATKTIKELEAEEPLLQENPNRFVLFPLKYHGTRLPLNASTRH